MLRKANALPLVKISTVRSIFVTEPPCAAIRGWRCRFKATRGGVLALTRAENEDFDVVRKQHF